MTDQLEVTAAFDGAPMKTLPRTTEAEMEQALQTAYELHQDPSQWIPFEERKAILKRTIAILESKQDEMVKTSAMEGGKPWQDTQVEFARALSGIEVAIEHMGVMHGEQIPMGLNPASRNRLALTKREPVGVVLAISAFNHPMNLIIHQVIPAIAVGCPVIVKPAGFTPLSCYNVVNALHEAGLPKGWAQVVMMSGPNTEKWVSDPRVSFLSFIGSGRVGWHLRSILPPGAHCALEHGGAAPVIVAPDADLQDALPLLVTGGFYHAGQVCVSVQRVYAHESICESLAQGMAEMASKLVIGDPTDPKTEVGPLISTKEVDRIAQWVEEAKSKGAKILCGGERISDTCYAPTVVLDPPEDIDLSCKEIFGPVVTVFSYKNRDEAIARANSLPFAFQAAVFTQNVDTAMECAKGLNANAVMVNDHTAFRVDWMPFGGRKESGLGLGGIPYSMHDMTYEKLLVLRSKAL